MRKLMMVLASVMLIVSCNDEENTPMEPQLETSDIVLAKRVCATDDVLKEQLIDNPELIQRLMKSINMPLNSKNYKEN